MAGAKPSTSPGALGINRPMKLSSSGYVDITYFESAWIQTLLGTDDAADALAAIGAVDPAAPVFEANVDMDGWAITNLGSPSNADDATSRSWVEDYVTSQLTALNWKASVKAATTGALVGAYNYASGVITFTSNGAFPSVDGIAINQGEYILVKNESNAAYNGIYTLTTAGSGGAAAVLTRRSDFDDSSSILNSSVVSVSQGTNNGDTAWMLTTNGAVTVGTTNLSFAAISAGVDNSTLPQSLGSAAAGNSTLAAPANHVHPTTGLILAAGGNDFSAQQKFSAVANAVTATKNTTYSVGATDHHIPCDTSGGVFTVTLPSAPTIGREIVVHLIVGTNALTVARGGSDNIKIDGSNATSLVLDSVDSHVTFVYLGSNVWAAY